MQQYEQLHYYGIKCDNLLSIRILEMLDTLIFRLFFGWCAIVKKVANEGLKIAAKIKQITKLQKTYG